MPDCERCGLWKKCKSPKIGPEGPIDAPVLFIGEAPGEQEDLAGRPFVGPTGKMLRDNLAAIGFGPGDVRFTNTAMCRPPGNKIEKKNVDYCKDHLPDEIATARIIVPVGGTALKAVLGYDGITKYAGQPIFRNGQIFFPILHPSYFLHGGGGNREAEFANWQNQLIQIADLMMAPPTEPVTADNDPYEYIYVDSIAKLREMKKRLLEANLMAFDTETATLRAYNPECTLLMVSYADDRTAWALPYKHSETPWPKSVLEGEVTETIKEIALSPVPKLGHNVKFDIRAVHGQVGVFTKNIVGDSMIASHIASGCRRGGHGLKDIAPMLPGMANYDAELEHYKASHPEANPQAFRGGKPGSYANIPMRILGIYGAKDSAVTFRVHQKLIDEMTDAQFALYSEVLSSGTNVLAEIESNGIAIDSAIAARYDILYRVARERVLRKKVLPHPSIRKMIADRQAVLDQEHQQYLADHPKGRRKPKLYTFNPESNQQVADWVYKYLKCPKPTNYFKKGSKTKSDDATPVGVEVLENFFDKHPVLEDHVYAKRLAKVGGTYLGPATSKWIDADGYARSTYNQNGASTGRLSSSDPNFQNIPAPDKSPGTLFEQLPIRNIFTHRWPGDPVDITRGGCVLSADYSGMELRVVAAIAAAIFGDPTMADAFRTGHDIHKITASKILTILTGKTVTVQDVTPAQRYRYKPIGFAILYGGDEGTVSRGAKVSKSEAREMIEAFFQAYPGIRDYVRFIDGFARDNGFVESPFGRRTSDARAMLGDARAAAAAIRSLTNAPVQGAASDTLMAAMVIAAERMRAEALRSLLVNTVHDSLMADIYPGELQRVALIIRDSMENVVVLGKKRFPGVDFDWLSTCPLQSDLEVGHFYGTLDHYDPIKNQVLTHH